MSEPSLPPHHGAPVAGEQIGAYRIGRRLGMGGMGTVYEALDVHLDRQVALKVIAPSLAGDPEFRTRFVREAQAQASLDSPHVVQVFAHGEDRGRLYIASQLIPDGDLGATLRRHGPPRLQVALELIAQVADGLAEAHRAGLVHRDIKPANVLLRYRGTSTHAYLADFGIARQVDGGTSIRPGGAGVAGTPTWMAPELHRGAAAGVASDIYALGCLLWATMTGRAPYEGPSDVAVVEAHVHAPVPQLPGRTHLEREANRVLRGAMAKDPGARHPSAAALRADLRSILAAAGSDAVRSPGRGRRVAVGAGAALLVAALVAAIVFGVTRLGSADEPRADAGGSSTDQSTGPAGLGGADGSEAQRAIGNIAEALEEHGDLDSEGAECTARSLVDKHGVDGLQDKGVLDEDLMLVGGSGGGVDPKVLADIFTSTFSCLWQASDASTS